MEFSTYYSRYASDFNNYKEEISDNIYGMVPIEVSTLLKQYGRLRTKEIFRKNCASGHLPVRPEKAMALVELMEGLDDWEYDGTVDTGYLGGGNCSLGHQLRYEHWAKSASTGKELVFGSTCAGDFFGIKPEVLKKIDEGRKQVTDEILFVIYLYNNNKETEYKDNVYGDLSEMCEYHEVNDKFIEMLGVYKDVVYQLMCLYIPIPKFVAEIISRLRKWYRTEYTITMKRAALETKLSGISASFLEHYKNIQNGDCLNITLNSKLRSIESFDSDTEILTCAIITSKRLEDNKEVIQKFDSITRPEVFYKKIKQYTVSNGKMKRLATAYEVEEKCLEVNDESSLIFPIDETNRALAALKYCCKNDTELPTVIDGKNKEYLVRICDEQKDIFKAIVFLNKHFEEYSSRIQKLNSDIEYGKADVNIPEIQPDYPFEYVFRYVKDNMKRDASPIVSSIMGRYSFHSKLSLKQGQIIRRYFKSLIGENEDTSDESSRIVSSLAIKYTSNGKQAKTVVYQANKEKTLYSICLLDSENKIIFTDAIRAGECIETDIDVSNVRTAIAYISDKFDIDHLSLIGDFNQGLKGVSIGKRLSKAVIGVDDKWVKFADIGKFVNISDSEYRNIYSSTSSKAIKDKSLFYSIRSVIMIAIAYNKIECGGE